MSTQPHDSSAAAPPASSTGANAFSGPRVVLGVAGGIAAYKACELLRLFTESGHDVQPVPTDSALRFVGAATWEGLSGKQVSTQVFEHVDEVPHVRIGQRAELVVVAPATADLLARAACGLADDLLTNILLTARCPVVLAPAMHTEMWEHPATRDNVARLRARGVWVIEPDVGRLTGKDSGKGRLPDPARIHAYCRRVLDGQRRSPDLAGRRVVVSAGGTREPLDPVRFLGNRSSGRQGYALAATAAARGAQVTLVAANANLTAPAGVHVQPVSTTLELRDTVRKFANEADAVVMAAAVADFAPVEYVARKLKKHGDAEPEALALRRNPDVLAELSAHRAHPGQVVVGFAAETDNVLPNGREKLAKKGCDLLVVNEVGEDKAFGGVENEAVVLARDGSEMPVPFGPKEDLADVVWDQVLTRLG